MKVLVTGADGFVGSHLRSALEARGHAVLRAVRTSARGGRNPNEFVASIGPQTQWWEALAGIDVVVHLAARVHVMRECRSDALTAFREVNVDGTRRLARQAAERGVRRFVFVSSVKVLGEVTSGAAFSDTSVPTPADAYGISKREGEDALREVARDTELEVVILRPPLVYGPAVKANFQRMLRWIDRGIPLPLAAVRNRRSLVYVGNLVDAVLQCLDHSAATGRTFLVDDGDPVSTPQLLREIGDALGRSARLFPVPPALLRWGAGLVGRGDDAARLLGDLVVDSSGIRTALGWRPPFSRREGLAATAAWFRSGPR